MFNKQNDESLVKPIDTNEFLWISKYILNTFKAFADAFGKHLLDFKLEARWFKKLSVCLRARFFIIKRSFGFLVNYINDENAHHYKMHDRLVQSKLQVRSKYRPVDVVWWEKLVHRLKSKEFGFNSTAMAIPSECSLTVYLFVELLVYLPPASC